MSKVTKILLVAGVMAIILMSNSNLLSQENEYATAKEKGLKIVLVVDVSPSIKAFKKVITDSISFIFDKIVRPGKDDVHLITFSLHAKLYDSVQDKISCINHINDNMSKWSKDTYPKYALSEVFGLLENTFPEKVGVVLFLSDGENTQADYTESDLYRSVRSLRTTGFTVYCIFLKTEYGSKARMENIANFFDTELYEITDKNYKNILFSLSGDIMKTVFISPFSRNEIIQEKECWFKDAKVRFIEAEQKWNDKYKTLRCLVIICLVFIVIFLISGIIVAKKLINIKSYRDSGDKFSLLWGKFHYLDDSNKNVIRTENLGLNKNSEYNVETPENYPDLKLLPRNRDERKVIAVGKGKGRVQFFNKEQNRCNNQYIDFDTRLIRVLPINSADDSVFKEYRYDFLNLLLDTIEQPVWGKTRFFGRKSEIQQITRNFSNATEGYFHYVISGMGNSGKTSFINHLSKEVFANDNFLKNKFIISLIGFDDFTKQTDKYDDFEKFKTYTEQKLENLKSEMNKRKILFVDDYDKMFDAFSTNFADMIYEWHHDHNFKLILAGKIPVNYFRLTFQNKLPEHIRNIPLPGLNDLTNLVTKTNIDSNIDTSIMLINDILKLIGFPNELIIDNAKYEIANLTGGFPFIIKKVLYEMISAWLEDYNKPSLSSHDVETAISTIIATCRDIMLKELCNYDNEIYSGNVKEVRFSEIINAICSIGKDGNIGEEELKNKVVPYPADNIVESSRLSDFKNKLDQLADMGAIVRSGECIIGTPPMFYHHGDKLIED